jgi:hypothetical protein
MTMAEAPLSVLQERLLLEEVVRPNQATAHGRAHGFARIRSVDDYRAALPLVTYEDLRPLIERMAAGEPGVLTESAPIAFFKTSGSTSKPKLIPATRAFAAQKACAFAAYWARVHSDHPDLKDGRMLANFGDLASVERSAGGTRILSETTFWNERMQIARGRAKWPTPPALRRIEDPALRYYAAARFALQGPLQGIMCLNPSTLLAFCRTIEAEGAALADGLRAGTLGRPLDGPVALDGLAPAPVPAALESGHPLRLAALWPDLRLVICWQSTAVHPYQKLVAPCLDGLKVRDYLTQSSECIMAIPTADGGSGGALACAAHFFEFIEDDDIAAASPRTLLPGELETGRIYELVASTAGGLYRYRTGDRLRVTGREGNLPLLDFVGRAGIGSSMTGEKLTEHQVREAGERASARLGSAPAQFLCFPRTDGAPHYGLLLSGLADDAAACWLDAFEAALQDANAEYREKRASGRLGAPGGLIAAAEAFELHRHRIAANRQVSLEQVKLGLLTAAFDLDQGLPARPLARPG